MRRLLNLMGQMSAEDMKNRVEFLSSLSKKLVTILDSRFRGNDVSPAKAGIQ